MSEETLGSKLGNPEDNVIDALGQKFMYEWNDTKMSEEALGNKLNNPEDKVIDALGQKIMSEWNDAKFARQEQEKVFIRAHRNNKGVYPPTMTFSGESRAKV